MQATGDVGTLLDVGKAAFQVADDPHLPELVCHVFRLSKMEQGQNPGPPCQTISVKYMPGKGVGLRYAVVPVRALVKVRERPILSMVVAGSVLLGLVAFGYGLGRRRGA